MTKKNLIFFNSKSGEGKSAEIADYVVEQLEKNGQQAEKLLTSSKEEAIEKIRTQSAGYQRLICIGGDGTLNVALTGLLHVKQRPVLGVIPAGTVNNFAQKWNLPLEYHEALKVILAESHRSIGIGECNGQAIVSSLMFGSLADVSNRVRQQDKQKYGLLGYPWQAIKQLPKQRSYPIEFYNSLVAMDAKVWVCLISTSNYIAGRRYLEEDSNSLHLTMLNNMKINKLLNYGYFALTGNLRRSTTLTSFDFKKLNVRTLSDKRISTRIDGDPGPYLPLQLSWHPNFIECCVTEKIF